MDIGTQIDIALGVLAFLAAQAFVGAGWFLFRLMHDRADSRETDAPYEGRPSSMLERT